MVWAITNSKLNYTHELLNECQEKVKRRNKLIRIADSNEAGWDTVKVYETIELLVTAMLNPGLIRLRTEHYEKENLHYPKVCS